MSDSRLVNLPPDILGVALLNAISDHDAITVMGKLSNTCNNPLYQFFKPSLDLLAAQQLLTYVVQGNAKNAKKMYMANPKLLFIEATAQEYAAGIDEKGNAVHRVVKASPFRAMAGCGDIWMLKDKELLTVLEKYIDESGKPGLDLAKEALEKHFPNGFDYPASTYDFKPLIDAITHDQQLIQTSIPNDTTEAFLTQFRNNFMPTCVTSGYFFNMNDLVKTFALYNRHYAPWSENQLSLFWCQVVGYLERLVTSVDAQVFSQGIANVDLNSNIKRTVSLHNYVTGKDMTYFPLEDNSTSRLGVTFGVDSYYGRGADRDGGCSGRLTEDYVKQKSELCSNLCSAYNSSTACHLQPINHRGV